MRSVRSFAQVMIRETRGYCSKKCRHIYGHSGPGWATVPGGQEPRSPRTDWVIRGGGGNLFLWASVSASVKWGNSHLQEFL